jgi:hypothetical protein
MPRDFSGFNKTYKDVCLERAKELLNHSKAINKPITLLYSGGIDSTTVAVSFLIAAEGDYSNIQIALNTDSIRENPKFYYQHIRNKLKMISSERVMDILDGNSIMVGGEFNDQLFGSDIYGGLKTFASMDILDEEYSEKNIIPFLVHNGLSELGAKAWYDLLDSQIRATRICEIKTVKDFFWWYNFSFKWQSVYYRIPARTNQPELINDEFLKNYYQQFFMADNFQKWSVLNPDKKINKSWSSYKLAAKEFIFEYTQDRDYFENKLKFGSLLGILRQRPTPEALVIDGTDNYVQVWTINKNEFYLEDNFFKSYT